MTRRTFLALLLIVALASPAYALYGEQLTVSTVVVGVPAGVLTACRVSTMGGVSSYTSGTIAVNGAPIYATWHDPAATPSASLGRVMNPGDVMTLDSINTFRAIRFGGVDASVYVTCFP